MFKGSEASLLSPKPEIDIIEICRDFFFMSRNKFIVVFIEVIHLRLIHIKAHISDDNSCINCFNSFILIVQCQCFIHLWPQCRLSEVK